MDELVKTERTNWPYAARNLNVELRKSLALINFIDDKFSPYSSGVFCTFCNYCDPYAEWYLSENERDSYNFLNWILYDKSIARKYIENPNLILFGDVISQHKNSEHLFDRAVKSIKTINPNSKFIHNFHQMVSYLEKGQWVDDNNKIQLLITLKAVADILIHNDENGYNFLVTPNNLTYRDLEP